MLFIAKGFLSEWNQCTVFYRGKYAMLIHTDKIHDGFTNTVSQYLTINLK